MSVQKLNNWLQQSGRSPKLGWDEICDGPIHSPVWTVTVLVEGRALGTGTATRKNQARDAAAQEALQKLREEYVAAGGVILEGEE